jgi:DNA invertase Pin-like site-specific DNA recombinase
MTMAYSYVRFSSIQQAKGDSLRRQTESVEAFCIANGLTLDTALNMKDSGKSAYKAEHLAEGGALGEFLKLVKDGKIAKGSWLIVESLDRLSRQSPNLAMEIFLSIINSGIVVHTLMDNATYNKDSNDLTYKLMSSLIYMATANDESVKKSQRLAAVWGNKKNNAANKPITSITPAWIRLNNGKLELIPEKAETVRMIFGLTLDGLGTTAIIRKFNQLGVQPISNRKSWGKSYIQKILNNPAVFGDYQPYKIDNNGQRVFDGEPINNYYPAVVDKQTFLAVKALKAGKVVKAGRKGKAFSNLFSGLCKCKCGATMRYNNKGNNLTYLQCTSNQECSGCDVKPYRYDAVERSLISALAYSGNEVLLSLDEKAKQEAEEANGKLLLVEADIAEINRKTDNLLGVLADTPSIALAKKLTELEAEKVALDDQRTTLQAVANKPSLSSYNNTLSLTGNLIKLLYKAMQDKSYESRAKLHKLIASIVDKIEFVGDEGKSMIIFYKSGMQYKTYTRNDIDLLALDYKYADAMTLEQEAEDDASADWYANQ